LRARSFGFKSALKKLGIGFACVVALGIALLYLTVRPPVAPHFVEFDCSSIAGWRNFPIENTNWHYPGRRLSYLIEPTAAYTSDIRHYVLETDLQTKNRCFNLKGYSDSETPEERYGDYLVIYTKYHERAGWTKDQVNQMSWWKRIFSNLVLGESQPIDPSPAMQAAVVDKPAGVYEWKDGTLVWVAPLGSTQNLWDVMFHSSLFDVIHHSGIYYVSPPGMGALTVIDLRTAGKS
jgi:hypothetical protein